MGSAQDMVVSGPANDQAEGVAVQPFQKVHAAVLAAEQQIAAIAAALRHLCGVAPHAVLGSDTLSAQYPAAVASGHRFRASGNGVCFPSLAGQEIAEPELPDQGSHGAFSADRVSREQARVTELYPDSCFPQRENGSTASAAETIQRS